MKQPYIYTMPEKFMEDESVPVKWRLYGYINGFWIAGKPVYASNQYFAEKLKCSERHISRALAELETDGLLTRNVQGFKRLVLQGGMTPDVRGGGHGVSAEGDMGGHHISDSISDSPILAVAKPPAFEIVSEKEEKSKAQPKYPHAKSVFELWGKYPRNWDLNATQLRAAENLYDERGIEEIEGLLEWYEKNKTRDFCPQVSSPYDLDSKWSKLDAFYDKQHA